MKEPSPYIIYPDSKESLDFYLKDGSQLSSRNSSLKYELDILLSDAEISLLEAENLLLYNSVERRNVSRSLEVLSELAHVLTILSESQRTKKQLFYDEFSLDSVDPALELFKSSKKYSYQAARELLALSTINGLPAHSDAAYTLAVLYSTGLYGIDRDERKAVMYLHSASQAGSLSATLSLVDRYLTGRGVPRDVYEALTRAMSAFPDLAKYIDSSGGSSFSQRPLILLRHSHMAGDTIDDYDPMLDPKLLAYEQSLAERGEPDAQRQLGYRYLTGRGVPQDLEAAYTAFEAAAAAGDGYAYFNLGYMLMNGQGGNRNVSAAKDYFEKASSFKNLLGAAYNGLGILHWHGSGGLEQNWTKSKEFFQLGARLNDSDAMHNLASCYRDGHGVGQNTSLAIAYYHKAQALGAWRSNQELTKLYFKENHMAAAVEAYRNFTKHIKHWQDLAHQGAKAFEKGDVMAACLSYAFIAEEGSPEGLVNLGWLLKSSQLSEELLLRAAGLNISEASLLLGHMYTRTNSTQAVEHYRAATAIDNNTEAWFSMGYIVEKVNPELAKKLYTMALETAASEAYMLGPWIALRTLDIRVAFFKFFNSLLFICGHAGLQLKGREAVHASKYKAPVSLILEWDAVLIGVFTVLLCWLLRVKRQRQQR